MKSRHESTDVSEKKTRNLFAYNFPCGFQPIVHRLMVETLWNFHITDLSASLAVHYNSHSPLCTSYSNLIQLQPKTNSNFCLQLTICELMIGCCMISMLIHDLQSLSDVFNVMSLQPLKEWSGETLNIRYIFALCYIFYGQYTRCMYGYCCTVLALTFMMQSDGCFRVKWINERARMAAHALRCRFFFRAGRGIVVSAFLCEATAMLVSGRNVGNAGLDNIFSRG